MNAEARDDEHLRAYDQACSCFDPWGWSESLGLWFSVLHPGRTVDRTLELVPVIVPGARVVRWPARTVDQEVREVLVVGPVVEGEDLLLDEVLDGASVYISSLEIGSRFSSLVLTLTLEIYLTQV